MIWPLVVISVAFISVLVIGWVGWIAARDQAKHYAEMDRLYDEYIKQLRAVLAKCK